MRTFHSKPYAEFARDWLRQPDGEHQTWFALADTGEAGADLYIYDFIGLFGVEAQAVAEIMREVQGKPLVVRLNSPGGSAFDAFAIYNLLREHEGGITTIVDGLAASAASLILMAGDKMIMKPGSQVMIHDAWGVTIGNADDHLSSAERLNEMSADLAAVYAARTGASKRMIRQMMKAETWFSPAQAVEAGFADQVDAIPTTHAQASFVIPEGLYKHPGGIAACQQEEETPSREAPVTIPSCAREETAPSRDTQLRQGDTARRRLRLAEAS